MRYHLIPVRMAISENQAITWVSEDVEKRQHLCTVGGTINWCVHCGKQYRDDSQS